MYLGTLTLGIDDFYTNDERQEHANITDGDKDLNRA